jgi:hypothetical protein
LSEALPVEKPADKLGHEVLQQEGLVTNVATIEEGNRPVLVTAAMHTTKSAAFSCLLRFVGATEGASDTLHPLAVLRHEAGFPPQQAQHLSKAFLLEQLLAA